MPWKINTEKDSHGIKIRRILKVPLSNLLYIFLNRFYWTGLLYKEVLAKITTGLKSNLQSLLHYICSVYPDYIYEINTLTSALRWRLQTTVKTLLCQWNNSFKVYTAKIETLPVQFLCPVLKMACNLEKKKKISLNKGISQNFPVHSHSSGQGFLFCFSFGFFKKRTHYVTRASLELTMWTSTHRSIYFYLRSVGIKGRCHHTWLLFCF